MFGPAALAVVCVVVSPWAYRDALAGRLDETFATTPFAASGGRWCERYHHAHYEDGAIQFRRSAPGPAACGEGSADARGRSCAERGCDPCDCTPPCSPCAKAGDPNGNAILMTTTDAPGTRRDATATFTLERALSPKGHVGLYVALHPHCHTTVQGLLVPDGGDRFHLNVAAFNQFIGGPPAMHAACRRHPFEAISPTLASGFRLAVGETYQWRLAARLAATDTVAVLTTMRDRGGRLLATGRYRFAVPGAARWFGVAGGAARYGFGAELTRDPALDGGAAALRLLGFRARP